MTTPHTRRRWLGLTALLIGALMAAFAHLWPNLRSGGPGERGSGASAEKPTGAAEPSPAGSPAVRHKLSGTVVDEAGEPVAAAKVVVRPAEGPEDTAWETATSAAGGFEFETISAETVAVEVSAALHERTVVPHVVLPAGSPVEITLSRTSAVSGVVRGPKRKPLADADVLLAGSGIWPPRALKTDAAGRFRFEPVPEGIYELRASLGTAVSEPLEGLLVDPGHEATVTLDTKEGAVLEGQVRDAQTGAPIAEADIEVSEDALTSRPQRLHSDVEGRFMAAGLRKVAHRVTLRVPGYVGFEDSAKPGGKPLDLRLLRAGTITGTVRDDSGEPVADAELEVRGHSEVGKSVRLGGGTAPAPSTPAPPRDFVGASDNLGVTQGRVPQIPLSGPAPTASTLIAAGTSAAALFVTDALGAFRLEGLPPGELRIHVRKAGFALAASEKLTLRSGAVREGVEITLSRGGILAGRVVDARGEPVAHVRVELRADNEADARSALSADDGSFRFEALRGPCSVTAYPYGLPPVRSPDLKVQVGQEQTVSLVIDGTLHTLQGRVLDGRQRPIENATVSVRALDPRSPFSVTALTGADGRFEISGLPAPPYRVTADQSDYAPSAPLTVAAVDAPISLTLASGTSLLGMVVDGESNEPIASARIELTADGKPSRSVRSRADGSFELLHVSHGDYSIFVSARGFIESTRKLTLAGDEDRPDEQSFVLTPAGSASGDVVDRLGAPLWNAEVAAGEPPQWRRAVRTDHEGHFVLGGLEPGAVVLSARERSAGSVTGGASLRVYARQESPGVVLRLPGVGGREDDSPAPQAPKRRSKTR